MDSLVEIANTRCVPFNFFYYRVLSHRNNETSASSNTPVNNVLPTASLTTPSTGHVAQQGDSITLTATAADIDGTVASVQFFNNGTAIGTDTSSAGGWSFTWTDAPIGDYSLTAKAVDNGSAIGHVSLSVIGRVDAPPTISLDDTTFGAGEDVTLSASTDDPDNVITSVAFYEGSTLLGTDSDGSDGWTYDWSDPSDANHTIHAVATENGSTISSTATAAFVATTPLGNPTIQANEIDFSWPAVEDADDYTIYRGATSNTSEMTLVTTLAETSYDDTGLDTATLYYYRIVANLPATETDPTPTSEVGSASFTTRVALTAASGLTPIQA